MGLSGTAFGTGSAFSKSTLVVVKEDNDDFLLIKEHAELETKSMHLSVIIKSCFCFINILYNCLVALLHKTKYSGVPI